MVSTLGIFTVSRSFPNRRPMPEVHVMGEIMGASGFGTCGLFCQWKIVTGSDGNWDVVRGEVEGQTQIDDGPVRLVYEPISHRGTECFNRILYL